MDSLTSRPRFHATSAPARSTVCCIFGSKIGRFVRAIAVMSSKNIPAERAALRNARRIVVKIGSRVLVQKTGRPDMRRMKALVRDIAELKKQGREIVVVSSGAIASGMEALSMKTRPSSLPELQMAAAVGQLRLMAYYEEFFAKHRCTIGQVLLTHDDLKDRRRHLNARNTMMALLRNGVIPIVNENDVVAVDEIRFGDNDLLASLVAILTEADLLILLSTVDGYLAPQPHKKRPARVPILRQVTDAELAHANGKGSQLSTGGMDSKLRSARKAAQVQIPVVIANGRSDRTLLRILAGEDVGTLIMPNPADAQTTLAGRKRWIAFFHRAHGAIIVDEGARRAIEKDGRSLLPIGVRDVHGHFPAGQVVEIRDINGALFACGITSYSSDDIRKIRGRKTAEIVGILGRKDYDEVIHRDNMVVMGVEPEARHEQLAQ
jgi:glutamate 5-kinase